MTRIILSGCNGAMGHVTTQTVKERTDCEIVAGVDISKVDSIDYTVVSSISEVNIDADVVLDFSNPGSLNSLISFCNNKKLPLVLCTTGFSSIQVSEIEKVSKKIPVFFSANMSLGINLLINLSKIAAKVLGSNFDIEVIEKHHNQKVDSPSGTAIMIADAISNVLSKEPQYIYDRHSSRKKRTQNEIGIHSIRGGTIVGEHEVLFAGQDETLSIVHNASSKKILSNGAINASLFIKTKSEGLYGMSDLIKYMNHTS